MMLFWPMYKNGTPRHSCQRTSVQMIEWPLETQVTRLIDVYDNVEQRQQNVRCAGTPSFSSGGILLANAPKLESTVTNVMDHRLLLTGIAPSLFVPQMNSENTPGCAIVETKISVDTTSRCRPHRERVPRRSNAAGGLGASCSRSAHGQLAPQSTSSRSK